MPAATQERIAVDVKKGVVYTLINNDWVPRKMTADEAQKYKPKPIVQKFPEEEGVAPKVARGAALGAFEGAGVSPGATSGEVLSKTLGGVKDQVKDMFAPWFNRWSGESVKRSLSANPAVAVPTSLAKGFGDVAGDINPALDNFFRLLSNKTGGKKYDYKEFDPEQTTQDITKMATQLALLRGGKKAAETPLAESEILSKGGEGLRTTTLRLSDAGPEDIKQAAREAAKETKNWQDQARQKLSESRREYETEERELGTKKEEIQKKAADERTEKFEKHQTTKREAEASAAERKRVQTKNVGFSQSQGKLKNFRNELAQKTREMLDRTLTTKEKYFDEQYKQFDKQILGATPENPKGTLQSRMEPVVGAVLEAKKNLITGSQTSITEFNNIMKGVEVAEGIEGEIQPVSGVMKKTAELRGFAQELGNKAFERDLAPDLKKAIVHVRNAILDEIGETIKDVHGQKPLDMFKALNKEYWDFKVRWSDTSGVNPLPKIRDMLRDKTVTEYGIPISERISAILKGEKGQSVGKLIAEDTKFGADPKLIDSLMAVDKKLKTFKDLYEKVPSQKPKFPGEFEEPAAPKLPPDITEAKVKSLGAPPEPFNPQEFVRERVAKTARFGGKVGMVLAIGSLITDILHGNAGASLSVAERIAAVQAAKSVLTSGKFLEWVSKEAK